MKKKIVLAAGMAVTTLALTFGTNQYIKSVNASDLKINGKAIASVDRNEETDDKGYVINNSEYEFGPEKLAEVDFDEVEKKASSRKPEDYTDEYIRESAVYYSERGYKLYDNEVYAREAGAVLGYEDGAGELYDFIIGFNACDDNNNVYVVKATPEQFKLFINSQFHIGLSFFPDSKDGSSETYVCNDHCGCVYMLTYDSEKEVLTYILNTQNCTEDYPTDGSGVG